MDSEIIRYINTIKNYNLQQLEEEYVKLKEEEEILKRKLELIKKRILARYPTINEPIYLNSIKIIKTKKRILDLNKLKKSIDITPYLKEIEITVIQVRR